MEKKQKFMPMVYYVSIIVIVIALLYLLVFLFSSCTKEAMGNPDNPPAGQKITVQFALHQSTYNGNELVVKKETSSNSAEGGLLSSPFRGVGGGRIIPLTQDIYMYATLEEDRDIKLCTATSNLQTGTKIRIVAYTNGTAYHAHADYTVSYTGELIDDLLQVVPGNYKFVAYAYNNTTLPTHDNTTIANINPAIDLLWGCFPTDGSLYTVTASTFEDVPITMSHLFSRVKLLATTKAIPDSLHIMAIDNVSILPAKMADLFISDGTLTQGNNTVQGFSNWTGLGTSTMVSCEARTVYTHQTTPTELLIGSVTLAGYPAFTNKTAVFDKQLLSGISYTLMVHFRRDLFIGETGSAGERIYIDTSEGDPKLMLTQNPANTGTMFQFGGIRGWNYGSGTVGNANYNPTTLSGAWNSTWQYANSQGNVVAHTLANLRAGKGDPCRLVGYTQTEVKQAIATSNPNAYAPDNGLWRLPTGNELQAYATYHDKISQQSGVWGYKVGSDKVFLPVIGYIYYDGTFKNGDGYYYSSHQHITTPSGNNANFLWLRGDMDNTVFLNAGPQAYGMSIRCVRQ